MENVTDALYMGFAVLAFVLAITISIGAFSQVTQVANYIVERQDRETEYTYVDYQGGETDRIVGEETIVPALYRAYEENYIVRFFEADGITPINFFEAKQEETGWTPTNEINLREMSFGSQEDANEFVGELLNGTVNTNEKFNNRFRLLQTDGLYGIIKESNFIETLGIYYEDDLVENETDDINKTEVRVITYTKV